jgi:hypothetical protein
LVALREKDLRFNECGADSSVFLVKLCGKLDAANGVNAHFERRDAKQASFSIGNGLDEPFFGIGSWLVLVERALDVLLIGKCIVA